jgi:hypothetical protein
MSVKRRKGRKLIGRWKDLRKKEKERRRQRRIGLAVRTVQRKNQPYLGSLYRPVVERANLWTINPGPSLHKAKADQKIVNNLVRTALLASSAGVSTDLSKPVKALKGSKGSGRVPNTSQNLQ